MEHYNTHAAYEQNFYERASSFEVQGGQSRALQTIERLASESAVTIFTVSSCCMCHVAKRLLLELGVSPTVYELDHQIGGQEIDKALLTLLGSTGTAQSVPAVFIGGKLVGGLEQLMTSHISGSLVPLLKQAGALWL